MASSVLWCVKVTTPSQVFTSPWFTAEHQAKWWFNNNFGAKKGRPLAKVAECVPEYLSREVVL